MNVHINEKIISIPPYVSTTWDQVSRLETEIGSISERFTLILQLHDGSSIKIPNLTEEVMTMAFEAHQKHVEQLEDLSSSEETPPDFLSQLFSSLPDQATAIPFQIGINGLPGIENIESIMQHDSSQADASDIPEEMLNKISQFTRLIGKDEVAEFPKPEPHCNCIHCQLARAMHGIEKTHPVTEESEPQISEEELTFNNWDIQECGDKVYSVLSRLDTMEEYKVSLEPIGCTCGQSNCEHVEAVLRS